MKLPEVYIIVLNWNKKDDTMECLSSLEKLDYPSYHVLLVDNGSTDETVKTIRERYPLDCRWLTIIETGENLGYAGGNNVGMRHALKEGAEYIWILNNDTIVEPYSLRGLIKAGIDKPTAGILGPRVFCYPERHILYSNREKFSLWFNRKTVEIRKMDKGDEMLPRKVDYVVGCSMLVSKKFVEKVGLLDETFFTYFEEIDWCFRGREVGFDILYVPMAVIYHKGVPSTGGIFSPVASYYRTRNWIYFMRKHAAFYHWIIFIPLISYVFLKRLLKAMVRGDAQEMKSLYRAIVWNIRLRIKQEIKAR